MKTKEELNALKEEVETVNEKLAELTPEELEQVNGGVSRAMKGVVTAVGVVSDTSTLQCKVAGVNLPSLPGQPCAGEDIRSR